MHRMSTIFILYHQTSWVEVSELVSMLKCFTSNTIFNLGKRQGWKAGILYNWIPKKNDFWYTWNHILWNKNKFRWRQCLSSWKLTSPDGEERNVVSQVLHDSWTDAVIPFEGQGLIANASVKHRIPIHFY